MDAPISKNAAKRAAKYAAKQEAKRKKRGSSDWEPPATDLLPPVNKRAAGCCRFKVILSYRGSGFHGWAPQHPPGQAPLRTVGDIVEQAFRTVLGQRVRVHPAGRTDAGVSAKGMVCQFDAETAEGPNDMMPRLNAQLPADCRVLQVHRVAADFEAMGCLWKRYAYTIPASSAEVLHEFCYRVLQSSGKRSPSDVVQTVQPIDLDRVRTAAQVLVGRNDFAAFQSKGGRKSTVRTLHSCTVEYVDAESGRQLRIAVEGDGFLYNMVRILSGTLLEAGCGLRNVEETAQLVAPKDVDVAQLSDVPPEDGETCPTEDSALATLATRALSGPTLPAENLCLEHVEYDTPWRLK